MLIMHLLTFKTLNLFLRKERERKIEDSVTNSYNLQLTLTSIINCIVMLKYCIVYIGKIMVFLVLNINLI